jgi:hypothetical protein
MRSATSNPLLEHPEIVALIAELTELEREKGARILVAIGRIAERTAQEQWRRRKAPMAAYWFAKGVDFRHLARALRLAPRGALI